MSEVKVDVLFMKYLLTNGLTIEIGATLQIGVLLCILLAKVETAGHNATMK